MFGKETSSPFAPVVGQVTCQMSRDELKQLFEQSGYGSNAALFEAYFVKDTRPPLCVVCRNTIQLHTNPQGENREPTNAWAAQQKTELPDKTVYELQAQIAARAAEQGNEYPMPYPMPPHWRDSAFRVFSYYSFKEMDIVFRNDQSPLVKAVWQCAAGPEGSPCEHTVKTDGLRTLISHAHMKNAKAARAAQLAANASEQGFKLLDMTPLEIDAMKLHLRELHGINVDAGIDPVASNRAGWSTSLCSCMDHPKSCIDCLCCYPCGLSCWCPIMEPLVREDCMILRLNKLTNHTSTECVPCLFCQAYTPKVGFTTRGHDPNQCLCNCCDVFAYPFWGFLMLTNLWILTTPLVFASQLVASIFTLCGLPCQDMPPALHNDCYQHRRYLVEQQGIPESHLQSKLITLCCWPCSECQVWRELQHNGIWPGLCLFPGSTADRAALEPSTVHRRLAVSNRLAGPMGPSAMGSPLTARIGACSME
jgi:hypothetical protein